MALTTILCRRDIKLDLKASLGQSQALNAEKDPNLPPPQVLTVAQRLLLS